MSSTSHMFNTNNSSKKAGGQRCSTNATDTKIAICRKINSFIHIVGNLVLCDRE